MSPNVRQYRDWKIPRYLETLSVLEHLEQVLQRNCTWKHCDLCLISAWKQFYVIKDIWLPAARIPELWSRFERTRLLSSWHQVCSPLARPHVPNKYDSCDVATRTDSSFSCFPLMKTQPGRRSAKTRRVWGDCWVAFFFSITNVVFPSPCCSLWDPWRD